jgi:DNA-binding NtrC family response regulator
MYYSEHGYLVDSASNGQKGLELIKNNKPDVVVSDNFMPELSGMEIASAIKDLSKKIPFILISSFKNPKEIIGNLDIFAYFEKPIDIKELDNSIARALSY